MPMNYNYLGNDVDSPTSMVNVVASALANIAREQREMELYRLRAQQLQEQGGANKLRAASALVRDIAAADLNTAKTTEANMRQRSANEIGRIMYERAAPNTNEARFNLFGCEESPIGAFKGQLDAADLRRHIAQIQALKDPTGVGEAVSGAQFGLNLEPSNQEQAFAGMTGKPSIETSAGTRSKNLLTGETINNPRPAGSPNMKSLSQAVTEKLASGVSSGYLVKEELPELFDALMKLGEEDEWRSAPRYNTLDEAIKAGVKVGAKVIIGGKRGIVEE